MRSSARVEARDHAGADRQRDFRRADGADIDSRRTVDPGEILSGKAHFRQALQPRRVAAARSQRGDIAGRRAQRRDQRRIVDLDVMAQHHHRRRFAGPARRHRLIGPAIVQFDAGKALGRQEAPARVDHHRRHPDRLRQWHQALRNLHRPHDQQPTRRIVAIEEIAFFHLYAGHATGQIGRQRQRAPGLARGGDLPEQIGRKTAFAHRLDQYRNLPAAGQADLPRIAIGHAIAFHMRRPSVDHLGRALQDGAFHAAARNTAFEPAIGMDDHMAAARTRCRSPCRYHRRQRHRRIAPFDRLADHRTIIVQLKFPVTGLHINAAPPIRFPDGTWIEPRLLPRLVQAPATPYDPSDNIHQRRVDVRPVRIMGIVADHAEPAAAQPHVLCVDT
eukprot:Opistho-2@38933